MLAYKGQLYGQEQCAHEAVLNNAAIWVTGACQANSALCNGIRRTLLATSAAFYDLLSRRLVMRAALLASGA
jgi:hypothetical protein